jgi:CheY-like chemotaxis protein
MSGESLARFVADLKKNFAGWVGENEALTVSTYRLRDHVYLDISRHDRDVPGVERVAEFGRYAAAADSSLARAGENALPRLSGQECACRWDEARNAPAYVSFRFAVRPEETAADRDAGRFSVLAIDDQTVILELITAMCQSQNYRVRTATSGEAGLRLAAEEAFDIVLVDLAMPGMSGLEVSRRLHEVHPDLPVILVTGWEVEIDSSQLAQAGISQVLRKPFRIEQLTELITATISQRIV